MTDTGITIDNGINPHYALPCPNCGSDDVARNCEVGISVRRGARLCRDCTEIALPHANATLDLIWELQLELEQSDEPVQFISASVQLLTAAIEHLLIGKLSDIVNDSPDLHLVPNA